MRILGAESAAVNRAEQVREPQRERLAAVNAELRIGETINAAKDARWTSIRKILRRLEKAPAAVVQRPIPTSDWNARVGRVPEREIGWSEPFRLLIQRSLDNFA
jgi:hypothetical protein